jgi:fucose 4-O-acetylase-like acetyltransferase
MATALPPELSKKFRFFSFLSMLLLVFVHGYNLNDRYLQPFTPVNEPMTLTAWTEYFLANGLFRFRIPMLFAISGYLFAWYDDKPHKERIKKRVKTLLVPYFLWSVIGLATAVVLTNWSWTETAVYSARLQPTNKFFEQYGMADWLYALLWPTAFQLWFIRCLFVYNLLYPWLKAGLAKRPWVLFLFFSLLWLSSLGFVIIEGEGLLFFTLGIWLAKNKIDVQAKPKWLSLPLFLFVFLGLCSVKTLLAFKGLQWLGGGVYFPVMLVLQKAVVFSGLLVAWFGMNRLVRFSMQQGWFVHLTAYSFIIYALHVPLVTYLIDPTFQLLQHSPYYRSITFILLPLTIIVFCVGCGFLMRQFIPKTYAILTGNRGGSIQ